MDDEKRYRQFEIMQQVAFMTDEHLGAIKKWLSKLAGVAYLCVLHDMDESSPHYHIMVKMHDARTLDDIARQCNIEKQYINIRSKSWSNALAYCFHKTESSRNDGKYEYDASCVVFAHNINYENIIATDEEYKRQKSVEDAFYKYGECKLTKTQLFKMIDAQAFHKYRKLYDNMKLYRATIMEDRNMQVIYICGAAGSGKTTLAKYMAYQLNYDYFISGSGKDVLDGYDKEECIILDDLRADAFTKSELFKLTDNNTNSSVKSRYQNKDISRCKLMIITSIWTPGKLYNWSDGEAEPADQFARRLQYHYVNIADDKLGSVYNFKIDKQLHIVSSENAGFNMSLVYGILNIVKDDTGANALLRSIADAVNKATKDAASSKK